MLKQQRECGKSLLTPAPLRDRVECCVWNISLTFQFLKVLKMTQSALYMQGGCNFTSNMN